MGNPIIAAVLHVRRDIKGFKHKTRNVLFTLREFLHDANAAPRQVYTSWDAPSFVNTQTGRSNTHQHIMPLGFRCCQIQYSYQISVASHILKFKETSKYMQEKKLSLYWIFWCASQCMPRGSCFIFNYTKFLKDCKSRVYIAVERQSWCITADVDDLNFTLVYT